MKKVQQNEIKGLTVSVLENSGGTKIRHWALTTRGAEAIELAEIIINAVRGKR